MKEFGEWLLQATEYMCSIQSKMLNCDFSLSVDDYDIKDNQIIIYSEIGELTIEGEVNIYTDQAVIITTYAKIFFTVV